MKQTQGEILNTQIKENKITAQQVKILEKMGLVDRSHAADIDFDVLARATAGNKESEAQIVREVGLKPAVDFGKKLDDPKNAALKALVQKYSTDFSKDGSNFDPFLKAVGDKFKKDPSVIDKLGAQLKDKETAARFEKDLVDHPKEMAALIRDYSPETFGASLSAIDGKPSAMAVVADASHKEAKQATQSVHKTKVSHEQKNPNIQNAALEVSVEAAPVSAVVGSPGVVLMAEKIEASVKKNFPDLEGDAKGFSDYVKSDPEAQKKIKEQLDANPEVFDLLNDMDTKDDKPINDNVRNTLSPFMKKFLNNPQKLETDAGMKETIAEFKQEKGKAQSNYLKDVLGFDISGMASGLGAMLEKAFSYVAKLFKAIGNNVHWQNSNGNDPLSGRLMISLKGYEKDMGQNGAVTMNKVDADTGRVVQTASFDPSNTVQANVLNRNPNAPSNSYDPKREYDGPTVPNFSTT